MRYTGTVRNRGSYFPATADCNPVCDFACGLPGTRTIPGIDFRALILVAALFCAVGVLEAQTRVLFDASHRENAGNADWVIDADTFDLNQVHFPCGPSDFENESNAQRFPTPASAGITASTPETYWTGAISAFGIDLVKAGYAVETLPAGAAITFGDLGNDQDLGNYDVFILPEPNRPFDAGETLAIRDFVAAGGGLFLITDHQTSDRDCDGFDSPHIGNDLMGVTIDSGSITDYGLYGIAFNVSEIAGQTDTDYWFTEPVDDNVTLDPSDPIIAGPHGSGVGGLGFFGATSMSLDPATNATVKGHVWKTDAGGQGNSRVTFATASYMSGRIACIGDSSPVDDGSGDPGDNLFLGWDQASGGVNNKEIHLNAVAWLAGPDLVAPAIVSGPVATAFDCSATIAWTTDEAADSHVEYGVSASYGDSEVLTGFGVTHVVVLPGLIPGSPYHFRAGSTDGSGNGPTWSSDATFTTGATAPPTLLGPPVVVSTGLTSQTATILWMTDEPSDSKVNFGTTAAYGHSVADPTLTTEHEVILGGLSPSTLYHFSVESVDGCLNGPAISADATFSTSADQIELSGWTLQQFDSTQSFVFPPGTTIPGNGYLVLARDASQASFESEWGPLPASVVFIDSGAVFPFINGGESFQLIDAGAAVVDGVTVAMSSGTTIQRNNPGDAAGDPGSWTVAGSVAGSPGSGAGLSSFAGVVINEASDATSFVNEFVELYYDAVSAGPDSTPPGQVGDLVATPESDTTIRLNWTAPGDDGMVGTATAYDVRRSSLPIQSEAAFLAATPVAAVTGPSAATTPETLVLNALGADSVYYFALRATDEVGNEAPLSNTVGATTGPAGSGSGTVTDHLVISELQARGAVGSDDEFIELYNPAEVSISIDGWSVQYKSASGTTWLRYDLPAALIPAGGYFLIARLPGYAGVVTPDSLQSAFLMSASGGHLFLVDDDTDLTSCSDVRIVDQVGYGSGDCPEGVAVSAHAAGQSLERLPGATDPLCGNGVDSDDNSSDFRALSLPDPQNSLSQESACRDLGNVGNSLYFGAAPSDDLYWASALGVANFKVRRSTSREFMQTDPLPDDSHLWMQPAQTTVSDPVMPASGVTFYYFVNAVDDAGAESAD